MKGSDVEDSLRDGSGCIETRKDTNGGWKAPLGRITNLILQGMRDGVRMKDGSLLLVRINNSTMI